MKKYAFFAAAAMLFASCSSEDAPVPVTGGEGETHPVEVTFDFTVASGTASRAEQGRPLYSSEPLQQVDELYLYIFKNGTYAGVSQQITDFNYTTPKGTKSHTYTFKPELEAATYQFLAIGREDGTKVFADLALTKDETTIDNVLVELGQDVEHASEIFGGISESYTIDKDTKSLDAKVDLYRLVAGVLGYFKNIPVKVVQNDKEVEVATVTVDMIKKSTNVNVQSLLGNATTEGYVTLLKIDPAEQGGTKEVSDGHNYWSCNEVTAMDETHKYTKVANSFLAGGYALPFTKAQATATFRVALRDSEGNVLKEYPVKLSTDRTTTLFDIEANHYYELGHKEFDGEKPKDPKDPDDPDDPDPENPDPDTPDPDEPIDLAKDQIIVVTVHATWTEIHHLVI